MSGLQTPLPAYHAYEANPPPWSSAYSRNLSRNASLASLPRFSESSDRDDINAAPTMTQPIEKEMAKKRPLSNVQEAVEPMTAAPLAITEKGKEVAVTAAPIEVKAEAEKTMAPLVTASPPKKRIDYLAGIVAVACLGVTLSHFFQTFLPWITQGYGPGAHWPEVERWLAIVVGAYVLNGFWIGMFFLTATRFLCANFLKNGKLDDIAKKELRRAPRLFVPIIIISLLQYFLISMNVTASLEYLPSVSFTTWPYVTAQPNFGVWINNMGEFESRVPRAARRSYPLTIFLSSSRNRLSDAQCDPGGGNALLHWCFVDGSRAAPVHVRDPDWCGVDSSRQDSVEAFWIYGTGNCVGLVRQGKQFSLIYKAKMPLLGCSINLLYSSELGSNPLVRSGPR